MPSLVARRRRGEQADSPFPFEDDAVAAGGRDLPRDAALDALLLVEPGATALLRTVDVSPGRAELTFGVIGGSNFAVAAYDASQPGESVRVRDDRDRYRGVVVVGPGMDTVAGWPPGSYAMNLPLVPAAVVPLPGLGVRSLRAEDEERLSGEVWLVGENGVTFVELADGSVEVNVAPELAVDAVCDPDGNPVARGPFVRRINGVEPIDGGVSLTAAGEVALRVYRAADGAIVFTPAKLAGIPEDAFSDRRTTRSAADDDLPGSVGPGEGA